MSGDIQLNFFGKWLAKYLQTPIKLPLISPPTPRIKLEPALRPGDVLLVEGQQRISSAIKYLTQSSWSHASLYIGKENLAKAKAKGLLPPHYDLPSDHCFIEADLVEGVRTVAIDEYLYHHTRICRPIGLNDDEIDQLCHFTIGQLGYKYDLRNIIDLMRYLLPNPPVPVRYRRQMLTLGSGDPTKAICSTLIAQAFQRVGYPILPHISYRSSYDHGVQHLTPIYHRRHYSLCTPRDFDVSPYFAIIKPSIVSGFDHHDMEWES